MALMPEPQVLYIVVAVVVLGLVAWVIAVIARGGKQEERPQALQRELAVPAGGAPSPREAARPAKESKEKERESLKQKKEVEVARRPSEPKTSVRPPLLNPHDEIQDGPSVKVAAAEVHVDVEEEEEPTGPNALILVTAVGRTDPGLKRKHNEDAYTILENHHLFVIADGMGRHAAGEVASQLCVEAIAECFNKSEFTIAKEAHLPKRANRIRSAILKANERILKASQENDAYAGMGTTVVAAYFSPNNQRVYIAHVGDSRCYRVRGGSLSQLTTDHTLGAAGITGKSAAVLSRAVGVEESVEVDIAMESPLPGDIYLLCSDGLSRMVADQEIMSAVNEAKELDLATKKLIDMANERGGRDNITTILVRVDDVKLALARSAGIAAPS